MNKSWALGLVGLFLMGGAVVAQHDHQGMDHNAMGSANPLEQSTAMMSNGVHSGPHMKMTALRPLKPTDREQADQMLAIIRSSVEKYRDVNVAKADGFKPMMEQATLKEYHFNNMANVRIAQRTFDPSRPTSLLYKKINGNFNLVGVMYTAPPGTPENELDRRVPLSLAQWHAHVNVCMPSGRMNRQKMAQFGPQGSISTQQECQAAGGRFIPQLFGWMVHVYPWENNYQAIFTHMP